MLCLLTWCCVIAYLCRDKTKPISQAEREKARAEKIRKDLALIEARRAERNARIAERKAKYRAQNIQIKVPSDPGPGTPYYETERWRRLRESRLRNSDYICQKCGGTAHTAHHTDYRWINTRYEYYYLVALCWPCHLKLHQFN
jgi:hypothetical protein